MSFHQTRRKSAQGSLKQGAGKPCVSPRIAVSLPPADMELLCWWASVHGKPVAEAIRDAVYCYLTPFRNNPTLKSQFEKKLKKSKNSS